MYTCLFSYFGSKSKLAHLYPEPRYRTIIEPFAGGAAYSLRYCDRDVLLYDISSKVIAVWNFLINSPDAEYWVKKIPIKSIKGASVTAMAKDFPDPIVLLLRAECNRGTSGFDHDAVTSFAYQTWHRIRPRLLYWLPRIRHWKVFLGSYCESPDIEATWFVDPPYQKHGGVYRNGLDYDALGSWCGQRKGQAIVCESFDADWIGTMPLCVRRGIYSLYQKSSVMEGFWLGDWGW